LYKTLLDTPPVVATIVRSRVGILEVVIRLFLGIDMGTGGTRALLINELGKVVASGTAEHQPFASPQNGWAEQNPLDWLRACGVGVRKSLASANARNEEAACIGFSGQMHGRGIPDESGSVIRPLIIWCD